MSNINTTMETALLGAVVNSSLNTLNYYERLKGVLNTMPIGQPMTCTEISEKVSYVIHEDWGFSKPYISHLMTYQRVSALLRALRNQGIIMREEIPCEPYYIDLEGGHALKIETKAVFTRLV